MKRLPALAAGLLLAGSLASASWAQQAGVQVPATATRVINLSLLEVLVAIKATDLAGVFNFVAEENTPLAMADYLMHDHRKLKMFIKKQEKDFKEVEGINQWDKRVLLFLVGINGQMRLPSGLKRIPERLMKRVNDSSLKRPLSLQVMVQRRAVKR
ncbi:hypothetical protein ACFL2T_03910 [Elusimicrobiota bacterium]